MKTDVSLVLRPEIEKVSKPQIDEICGDNFAQVSGYDRKEAFITVVYDFLDELSPGTRRAYLRDWHVFFQWRKEQPERTPAGELQAFVTWFRASGKNPQRAVSAVRSLARQLAINEVIPVADYHAMQLVRVKGEKGKRIGRWLSKEQAQSLLEQPGSATLGGRRDTAILALLLGAGLRRSEVAGLVWGHVDNIDGVWVLRNLVGKHKRVRSVPLASWVYSSLVKWAGAAGLDMTVADAPVFWGIRKDDEKMQPGITGQAVWRAVEKHAGGAGIVPPPRPHDLRRTFSRQYFLAERSKLLDLKDILGHASLQTTEVYVGAEFEPARTNPDKFLEYGL